MKKIIIPKSFIVFLLLCIGVFTYSIVSFIVGFTFHQWLFSCWTLFFVALGSAITIVAVILAIIVYKKMEKDRLAAQNEKN